MIGVVVVVPSSSSTTSCLRFCTRTRTLRSSLRNGVLSNRNSRGRSMSSSVAGGGMMKRPAPAVLLPPRVISRRAWESYQRERSELFRRPPPPSTKEGEEKAWPKNVIYTAYVMAGIFIPYTVVWTCVNDDTLRPYMLRYILEPTKLEPYVRRHFGTPEWHAIAYPDQIAAAASSEQQLIQTVPHCLMGEPDYRVRENEARIAATQEKGTVVVRVQVVQSEDSSSGSGTVVMEEIKRLSRKLMARPQEILSYELPSGSSLAIDFPQDDDDNDDNNKSNETTTTMSKKEKNDSLVERTNNQLMSDSEAAAQNNMNHSNHDSSTTTTLDWRKQIAIYSSWHYQPIAPPTSSGSGSSSISSEELRVMELKELIAQLERELRAGTRDVDSIESDITRAKAQMRKLTWGKWLPTW